MPVSVEGTGQARGNSFLRGLSPERVGCSVEPWVAVGHEGESQGRGSRAHWMGG